MPLLALASLLGVPSDSSRLREALTHSSYAAEHGGESNERLEFLGDAVVDLAVADHIVLNYPSLNEGAASVLRSRVVNEASLALVAREIELGECLFLGRGVRKEHGADRDSLLADAFEAVVAALYLDRGFDAARDFVVSRLSPAMDAAANHVEILDAKTRLRRWAEVQGLGPPTYEVQASGPSHDMTFEATVRVGSLQASATASSKKRAESRAAEAVWEGAQHARTA